MSHRQPRRGSTAALALGGAIAAGLVFMACAEEASRTASHADDAHAIGAHEDPVCGMLVREQTAPRGQLVHRDGERFFFCSLGDLLVHLAAPSPHGQARSVFVEVLEVDDDPAVSHTGARPWVAATDAHYVVGVPRPGVMGAPILAYRDAQAAGAAIARLGVGEPLDFPGLEAWWAEAQRNR